MILGGEHAQFAYNELEETLRACSPAKSSTDSRSSRSSGSVLGDALTVILMVQLQPSISMIQSALSSPCLFPILSTLMLQFSRFDNTLYISSASARETADYSLSGLFLAVLNSRDVEDATIRKASIKYRFSHRLSGKYLIALLVLHGRMIAAVQLNWRLQQRPIGLFNTDNGWQCLLLSLQHWKSEQETQREDNATCVYKEALAIIQNILK